VQAHAKGAPITKKVYPYQIAFNAIPQVDSFGSDGYTGEETKMRDESRKIMGLPALKVSATCVRVPVVRAHSVAVNAEFERPVSVEAARAAIAAFAGAQLVDDPSKQVLSDAARFQPAGEVRRGSHPHRFGARQRPLALGQRRQSLERRRPQCPPKRRAHGSRGLCCGPRQAVDRLGLLALAGNPGLPRHHGIIPCHRRGSQAFLYLRLGRLAQLVSQHLAYTEGVGGSSPSASTILISQNNFMRHTIFVLVENTFGVLARVTGMIFRPRLQHRLAQRSPHPRRFALPYHDRPQR